MCIRDSSSVAAPYATVTTDVTPHLPFVDLSSEAIERIAINLVRNASESIRHSQFSGGKIHVCLSVVAGRLRLSVEDNGPGMPPAQAAAFLHPAPLPPGAIRGYGHRNVHELAEITCGRLGIHVRPGRGTTPVSYTHLSVKARYSPYIAPACSLGIAAQAASLP